MTQSTDRIIYVPMLFGGDPEVRTYRVIAEDDEKFLVESINPQRGVHTRLYKMGNIFCNSFDAARAILHHEVVAHREEIEQHYADNIEWIEETIRLIDAMEEPNHDLPLSE